MEKETGTLMDQIHRETVEVVEPKKKIMQVEEAESNAVMLEAQALKIDC